MTALTDFAENRGIDGLLRGGCLTTAGAFNSAAVVKGIWTATTAYAVGDIVVPHASMTGAGGKMLKCTVAGTSGSTNTLAVPNPGSTLTDSTVTWTAIATMPSLDQVYIALFTVIPTDAGGGTEVSGNNYARVAVPCTMVAWAGTQAAASVAASSGVSGLTSNNNTITFPTPSATWGTVVAFGIFDALTGGNLMIYSGLTVNKTINTSDSVTFPAASLTFTIDN